MTRVDFHTNLTDKLGYTCRLVRKAYAAGGKVVVLAQDAAQAACLDEALWTFSDTDFVPHVPAGHELAARTPVIVALPGAALPQAGMLVNLTHDMPADVAQFSRVFEMVGRDEGDVAAGRARYAAYKRDGFALEHHVAG